MKIFKISFCALVLVTLSAFARDDYPIKPIEMTNVVVRSGFWMPRIETNRLVTVPIAFKRCEETGRIHNFEAAARRDVTGFRGIPYDDSDVYKAIQGAVYTLATHPNKELEKYLDNLISNIAKAQEPDGYLYTARTLGFNFETNSVGHVRYMMGTARWSNIYDGHELYNVGHMYEAAVAHYLVTGKRTFLDVAIRNADLIDRTFGFAPTQLKDPPGHEEIELALCSLYRATGDKRYLTLSKTFLDLRGRKDLRGKTWEARYQDHIPVVEQREALGHAVRAGYLYCGMADVAALTGDKSYAKAIDALWGNVVSKKLHLNGGIGARRHVEYKEQKLGHAYEALSLNYDLPNEEAYLETCASVANALWNQRMFLTYGDAKYIDVLERVIYNGFLSGVSLKGDEFFYPNPLASKGGYTRSKWFGTSCCPVNIVRFIPQIPQFAYAARDNEAYINLFIDSDAKLKLQDDEIKLSQKTGYPWDGNVKITVDELENNNSKLSTSNFKLNIRVPGWCVGRPVPSDLYEQTNPGSLSDFKVKINGVSFNFTPKKGYCCIARDWKKGDVVEIEMNMPVKRIKAHDQVKVNSDRLAVERGPILYCAEGVDNAGKVLDKVIAADAQFKRTSCNILGNIYPAFSARSTSGEVKLIPYFAWAHRGDGEMQTWFLVK